jgi:L-threonylcarbamoyladenylate synthase
VAPQVRVTSADREAIAEAVRVLRAGGIVAYPTDTLYGLAVDPMNESAVGALFALKGRGGDQAIPLIATDVAQAASVAVIPPLVWRLANRFWPGPLTVVVRSTVAWPAGVAAADGTIALRVPDHPVARALARGFARPITATSANRSGEPAAVSAADVLAALGDGVAIVVDGGPCAGGPPSTVVDVTGTAPRLVRAGVVPWERVLESLK